MKGKTKTTWDRDRRPYRRKPLALPALPVAVECRNPSTGGFAVAIAFAASGPGRYTAVIMSPPRVATIDGRDVRRALDYRVARARRIAEDSARELHGTLRAAPANLKRAFATIASATAREGSDE